MIKYTFAFIAMMAVTAFASPVEEETQVEALSLELEPGMYREFDAVVRMSRVTCDVLSGWGVDHTACALHCIYKGYKGGRCINGVCNCRN